MTNQQLTCGFIDTFNKYIFGFNKKKYPIKICKSICGKKIYTPVPHKYNMGSIYVVVKIDTTKEDNYYGHIDRIIGRVGDIDAEKNYLINCVNIYWKKIKNYENDIIGQIHMTNDRIDLTHLNTFSVDPENCYDIDDAFDIELYENNNIMNIHIADVSYFIPVGSDLDKEIKSRVRSCYLNFRQIDMLPEDILKLCSLNENEERNAFSMRIYFDNNYNITKHEFVKTKIINKKKLSYNEVNDFMGLSKKFNIDAIYNFSNSLNSETKNNPHKLVETFMIFINKMVALRIKNKYPNEVPIRKQVNTTHIENKHENNNINEKIKMHFTSSAQYSIGHNDNDIHESLKENIYTHFSSPIRRYFDIIVHRYLYNAVANNDTDVSNIRESIEQYYKDIKYINEKCKFYKKIEYKSNMLLIAIKLHNIEEKYEKTYNAIVIDIDDNIVYLYVQTLELNCYSKIYSKKNTFIKSAKFDYGYEYNNLHTNVVTFIKYGDLIEVNLIVLMKSPKEKLCVKIVDLCL